MDNLWFDGDYLALHKQLNLEYLLEVIINKCKFEIYQIIEIYEIPAFKFNKT